MVDNNGVVKLADFGASKQMELLMTTTGNYNSLKGTPYWMAPEVPPPPPPLSPLLIFFCCLSGNVRFTKSLSSTLTCTFPFLELHTNDFV